MIDFRESLDEHLYFVEFSYNNSYHYYISMSPFKALYDRICRSPIGWFIFYKSSILVPDLIYMTLEKFHFIRNRLQKAYSRQKSYADNRRTKLEFEEGNSVF